ncbi:hypothetical protein ACXJJ3_37800 [Kribbella sp. WER1]
MKLTFLPAIAAAAVAAAVVLAPATAQAAPSPARPASEVTTSRPAAAAGISASWSHGCNGSVCIYARYTGTGWEAYGQANGGFYGHIDVFGPDHVTHHSGPDRPWNAGNQTTHFTGRGAGSVCAQAWKLETTGRYSSIGLPCVTP